VIRAYIDALIAIFIIIVVFFISIRMGGTFTRLVEDVTSRVAKPQRANELVESFLYIVTLVIIATTTLLVSFPLIERTFGGVIG
jgi:nucleoside recognition membrane protein YjiH